MDKDAFHLNFDISAITKEDDTPYFTSIQFDEKKDKVRFINYSDHTIYEASISIDWSDIERIKSYRY